MATLLSRLQGKKKQGKRYIAKCPAHEDKQPSLSIGLDENNGTVLVTCHAGCSLDDIVSSVGLTVADLFSGESKTPEVRERVKDDLTATYEYFDQDGELVMQVLRYVRPDGSKTFRQRRPNPDGGWDWNTTGLEKPLYRLPQILRAAADGGHIYLVEGEKDVQTLEDLGLVATTSPGGAGKWEKWWAPPFDGASMVTIIVDNDEPGYRHGEKFAAELAGRGIPVEILKAPGNYKDISQFILSGGDFAKLIPYETIVEPTVDEFLVVADLVDDLRHSGRSEEDKLERLKRAIERVQVKAEPLRMETWMKLTQRELPPQEWIIPNFIERGDRVILVAPEGVGKSMFARQLAIQTALGINFLTNELMDRGRSTLYIDLENPERLVVRKSKDIYDNAIKYISTNVAPPKGRDEVVLCPQGLNVLQPRDRARLEEAIEKAQPEFVLLGPLYKSFIDPGNQTSEAVVTTVVKFFDYLRVEYNFALWLEHHPPLGDSWTSRPLRPFGSSVWSRWPEFGLSMVPDLDTPGLYNMATFRGSRDERKIPKTLKRGGIGGFPFVVMEYL